MYEHNSKLSLDQNVNIRFCSYSILCVSVYWFPLYDSMIVRDFNLLLKCAIRRVALTEVNRYHISQHANASSDSCLSLITILLLSLF